MLVKDPNQRYTIEQIKKHKWMQADPAVKTILSYNDQGNLEGDKILDEYNEQALELMHGLGIDIERTKTVRIHSYFSLWGKKTFMLRGETGFPFRMTGQSFGTGRDSHGTRNETRTSFLRHETLLEIKTFIMIFPNGIVDESC